MVAIILTDVSYIHVEVYLCDLITLWQLTGIGFDECSKVHLHLLHLVGILRSGKIAMRKQSSRVSNFIRG